MRRYEYRPQVSHMIDGPSPVYTRDLTTINDGKMNYTIDPETDLSNVPSAPAVQNNGMPVEDGSDHESFAMAAAETALIQMQQGKPKGFAPGMAPDMYARWTTWDGIKVLDLVEEFAPPPGRGLAQRYTYRLDPAHDLALISYEFILPNEDKPGQPRNVYEVDRFAKSSAGFFYPAVYRLSYAATGTDKYSNTSQQSVTTITTYEPLPALPAHITDLPKPKGSEYVGDNNEVVQPAAMHVTVLDAKTKKPVAHAPVAVRMSAPNLKDFTTDDRRERRDRPGAAQGGSEVPFPQFRPGARTSPSVSGGADMRIPCGCRRSMRWTWRRARRFRAESKARRDSRSKVPKWMSRFSGHAIRWRPSPATGAFLITWPKRIRKASGGSTAFRRRSTASTSE